METFLVRYQGQRGSIEEGIEAVNWLHAIHRVKSQFSDPVSVKIIGVRDIQGQLIWPRKKPKSSASLTVVEGAMV